MCRFRLAAVGVWLLIVKANYKIVERVFLIASAIYLAYIASGIMAHPNWTKVAADFVTPSFKFELAYVTIFVTAIGTTIAPWMQFYQQASIVDKGIKPADYAYERIDVIVGSIFAIVVAGFIIIACSADHLRGRKTYRNRQRRGPGAGAAGGKVRLHPIRLRPAERERVLRGDSAPFDRLRGVRSVRLGERGG